MDVPQEPRDPLRVLEKQGTFLGIPSNHRSLLEITAKSLENEAQLLPFKSRLEV